MATAILPGFDALPMPAGARAADGIRLGPISVVRDAAGFARWAPAWAELMREHGPESPFWHEAWLRSLWELRAARLCLVLCGTPRRLEFGAAFCWADDAGKAVLVPMRLLSCEPHLGTIHPGHAVVAATPRFDRRALPALLTRATRAGRWSTAFINHLDDGLDWFADGVERFARGQGWMVRRGESPPEAYVDFSAGPDAYLRTRSKHWRDKITNSRNRCLRAGVVCRDPIAERWSWPALAEAIGSVFDRSWQRGSEIGPLTPRYRHRFIACLRRLHAAGLLRAPLLVADGKPIAVDIALRASRTLHLVHRAYDGAWRHVAPGVVLVEELIRRGWDEGARGLHLFGYAHEHTAYKRFWMTRRSEVRHLRIVRPWSWYAPLDAAYRWLPGMQALWWRTGVGQRLRERWWRRAATRTPR